jgi:hypothetical protein
MSVRVPVVVPYRETLTPARGDRSSAESTVPATVLICATRGKDMASTDNINVNKSFFIKINLVVIFPIFLID